jgi:hypothetical protein
VVSVSGSDSQTRSPTAAAVPTRAGIGFSSPRVMRPPASQRATRSSSRRYAGLEV